MKLDQLMPSDNANDFLIPFERVAIRKEWPKDRWSKLLQLLLVDKMRLGDFKKKLSSYNAKDYPSIFLKGLLCRKHGPKKADLNYYSACWW